MVTLRAEVRNGRLVLDVPTDLPEGTQVDLEAAESLDLDAADRAELIAALARSVEQAASGQLRSAHEFAAELRRQQ